MITLDFSTGFVEEDGEKWLVITGLVNGHRYGTVKIPAFDPIVYQQFDTDQEMWDAAIKHPKRKLTLYVPSDDSSASSR